MKIKTLLLITLLALLTAAPTIYLPLIQKGVATTAPTNTLQPTSTHTLTPTITLTIIIPTHTPTLTSTIQPGPCDCTGPDLDCADFPNHNAAQACFDYCYPTYGDVFGLDADGNGLACESLP